MEFLPARLIKRARDHNMPFGALNAITELRAHLTTLENKAIEEARAKGASWEDIAGALGITRQALQQRLARGKTKR
jgi:DNA-directed RNA polymerase specialized sigma24 family protein